MTETETLKGKTALITGGSRGIGYAVAREFVAAGAAVIIAARNRENVESAAAALKSKENREVYGYAFDVADPGAVHESVGEILEVHGRIDILVNNAGGATFRPVTELTNGEWREMIDAHLGGAFYCSRAVLPSMLDQKNGTIVNICSVAAIKAFPGNAGYGAAKSGLLMFTRVLREEVRDKGIRVTAVIPGATGTGIWDTLNGDFDRTKMIDPHTIAETVRNVCTVPRSAVIEEVVIRPAGGDM